MNFATVKSLTIPEGNVVKILSGSLVLWSKGSSPSPGIELPPSNQIWYEATEQLVGSNIGSPTSHTFDSSTGKGILTYATNINYSSDVARNAFMSLPSLTKIWWPASCQAWREDCMHTCTNLQEIYAGSSLQDISNGTCNGGTTPRKIVLVDNNYFYENETGLVKKSDNVLYLGTYNLDIRDTPCTTLGNRCMADQALNGATLYFPATMTGADGDWYIGNSYIAANIYTIYLPCPTAPNWTLRYIRGKITWYIPAVNSGYENWKSNSDYTVIENL